MFIPLHLYSAQYKDHPQYCLVYNMYNRNTWAYTLYTTDTGYCWFDSINNTCKIFCKISFL